MLANNNRTVNPPASEQLRAAMEERTKSTAGHEIEKEVCRTEPRRRREVRHLLVSRRTLVVTVVR